MSKKPELRFIDEHEVPLGKNRKSTEEWLRLLRQIPKGKALVLTDKDTKVSVGTVRNMVLKFIKEGKLPRNYRVIQHEHEGGNLVFYVINSEASGTPQE